jgi:hypothetical protein
LVGSALGTDTMSSAMLTAESLQAWTESYAEADAPFVFGTDRPAELLAQHRWRPTLHTYDEVAESLRRSWPSPPDSTPRAMIITATLAG